MDMIDLGLLNFWPWGSYKITVPGASIRKQLRTPQAVADLGTTAVKHTVAANFSSFYWFHWHFLKTCYFWKRCSAYGSSQ